MLQLCDQTGEERILECSTNEIGGVLQVCLRTSAALLIYTQRALRVTLEGRRLSALRSVVLVPTSTSTTSLVLAILDSCGRLELIKIPGLTEGQESMATHSLDSLLSSPETTTLLRQDDVARSGCFPQSLIAMKPCAADATFLIIVGCDDGSIIEIYGVKGSAVRRHILGASLHGRVARMWPLELSTFPFHVLACSSGVNLELCCSPSASALTKNGNAEDDVDDDGGGIWRDNDPALSCDSAVHLDGIQSHYYVSSELKYHFKLCVSPAVSFCRGRDVFADESPALSVVAPGMLDPSCAFVKSMVALAQNRRRGVEFLDSRQSSHLQSAGSAGCVIITLCPALQAMYLFALPLGHSASSHTTLYPEIQIDLRPLLCQLVRGIRAYNDEETATHASLLNSGELLAIGTSSKRLVICGAEDLVARQNYSLPDSVLEMGCCAIASSSSLFIHTAAQPLPPAHQAVGKEFKDANEAFEALELSSGKNRNEVCAKVIAWVSRTWTQCSSGEDKNLDGDELLELGFRCLLTLVPFVDDATAKSTVSKQTETDWSMLLARVGKDSDEKLATEALLQLVHFAALNQRSVVPRLLDACGDMGNLTIAALLFFLSDDIEASALAYFHLASTATAPSYQQLLSIAEEHLERLCSLGRSTTPTLEEASSVIIGLIRALQRIGTPCKLLEAHVLDHWASSKRFAVASRALYNILIGSASSPSHDCQEYCAPFRALTLTRLLV